MLLSNSINLLRFCSLCLHANAQLPCTNVKQVSQESKEHSNHYDSNNDDHRLRFYLCRHHHHHHHHQGTNCNVLLICVIAYYIYIHISKGRYANCGGVFEQLSRYTMRHQECDFHLGLYSSLTSANNLNLPTLLTLFYFSTLLYLLVQV